MNTLSVRKKILIIDDDPGIQNTLKYMLEEAGYEVYKNSGDKIEEAINNFSPDLILLDIWMPKVSGEKVSKQIKTHKTTKHIPIILISAVSESVKVIKESRADGFLAKPFNMYDLLFIVKDCIEKTTKQSFLI